MLADLSIYFVDVTVLMHTSNTIGLLSSIRLVLANRSSVGLSYLYLSAIKYDLGVTNEHVFGRYFLHCDHRDWVFRPTFGDI